MLVYVCVSMQIEQPNEPKSVCNMCTINWLKTQSSMVGFVWLYGYDCACGWRERIRYGHVEQRFHGKFPVNLFEFIYILVKSLYINYY